MSTWAPAAAARVVIVAITVLTVGLAGSVSMTDTELPPLLLTYIFVPLGRITLVTGELPTAMVWVTVPAGLITEIELPVEFVT